MPGELQRQIALLQGELARRQAKVTRKQPPNSTRNLAPASLLITPHTGKTVQKQPYASVRATEQGPLIRSMDLNDGETENRISRLRTVVRPWFGPGQTPTMMKTKKKNPILHLTNVLKLKICGNSSAEKSSKPIYDLQIRIPLPPSACHSLPSLRRSIACASH